MFDPETLGVGRRLVPVVLWLVEQQARRLAGANQQETIGHLRNGQPGLEVGIDHKGVVAVIKKARLQCAGGNDHASGAGKHGCIQVMLLQTGEVGWVQIGQVGGNQRHAVGSFCAHCYRCRLVQERRLQRFWRQW